MHRGVYWMNARTVADRSGVNDTEPSEHLTYAREKPRIEHFVQTFSMSTNAVLKRSNTHLCFQMLLM